MSLLDLSIPPLQVNAEELTEQDHILLQEWKPNALATLHDLKRLVDRKDENNLQHGEVANLVVNAIPFDGDNFWSSETLRTAAQELLRCLPAPTLEVVTCVLSGHLKPRFIATPHPKLNTSSGRALPEKAQLASTARNFYVPSEQQKWKAHPGTAKLLLWSIAHLKPEDYEGVWHLVIPPIMTLLDDYQTYYRLAGVRVVSELLQRVPPRDLKRTGVDGLLISSLRRSILQLHNPLTPMILCESVQTLLTIIKLTTPPHSQPRFSYLCSILGDDIIGSVWVYASQEVVTVEASLALLPDILRELGIGSVRYLKALIQQMVHNLNPLDAQYASIPLQIASLQALEVIIEVCRPRIYQWRGHIVDGMGRCWVSLVEQRHRDKNRSSELRSALRRISAALATACPSVVEDEYKRLLACDENMFRDLLLPKSNIP